MDTRLPMMVQSPDFAGSMMNGLNAGGMARQAGQQNALANLYQTQGPQIMAGDPGALNALARMDPTAAMGVQQNQLGMQATRLGMEQTQMQMQAIRDNAKAKAAEAAAGLDAAKVAAEIDQTKRTMAGAAPLLMAWKQNNDPAAAQALIAYLGRNGVPVTLETLEPTIYAMQGGLEGLTDGLSALEKMQGLMPEPVEGPAWVAATPDQAAQYGAGAGQINTKTGEFKKIDPPSGGITITNPDGTTTQIGGPAGGGKPATVDENKNAGFLLRMNDSQTTLNKFESQGTDLGAALLSQDPTGLSNYVQTPEYQMYDQAKRDFINAQLRRESGAIISPEEFANAEVQYFPRPGDSPEVIAQKRKNRENAIAGIAVGSGPAAGNPLVAGSDGVTVGGKDFSKMDVIQMGLVDLKTLTPAERTAMSARLKELGF